MNLDHVDALLRELAPSAVMEMEIEEPGLHLRARRLRPQPAAAQPVQAQPQPTEAEPSLHWVEAGLVGVFHEADRPIAVGDRVEAGQEVGVIDSLRVPNPVRAERSGTVVEVLVADGDPVEYGQPLLALQE